MVPNLSDADRLKLARICELLRSDNAHERAIAALRATEMLKRAGLTWTELVAKPPVVRPTYQYDIRPDERPGKPRYVTHGRHTVESLFKRLDKLEPKLGAFDRSFSERLRKRPMHEGLTLIEWEWAERAIADARRRVRPRSPMRR